AAFKDVNQAIKVAGERLYEWLVAGSHRECGKLRCGVVIAVIETVFVLQPAVERHHETGVTAELTVEAGQVHIRVVPDGHGCAPLGSVLVHRHRATTAP